MNIDRIVMTGIVASCLGLIGCMNPKAPTFRMHTINADSRFEAVGVFNVGGDDRPDIFCGGFWYEAPNWQKHFVRDVPEKGNYYYDFAAIPADVDGNGTNDIISCAWHDKRIFWVENPGREDAEFKVHTVDQPGNMETAVAADFNGDGQTEVLPCIMKSAAWYEFHRDPSAEHNVRWEKHDLPEVLAGEGIGAGDINGDGRCDIVGYSGWYEQPANSDATWLWHSEYDLGRAGIPILVSDVDGDDDADILWGIGHDYGLYWLEQEQDVTGRRVWSKHEIDISWSQVHTMLLADLDNDGQKELVTGKRYHAHNGHDPGSAEPRCLYYYSYDRDARKWQRHTIQADGPAGFGLASAAADVDGDGDIDIVACGKSGLYLFENQLK